MTKVVIIGGGISGLSAAHYLLNDNAPGADEIDVTLLEASLRLGGILHTEKMAGYVLEHGSDSFVISNSTVSDLCIELGLGDEIISTSESNRRSLVAYRGRLVSLPDGFRLIAPTRFWPFALSVLLSLGGKLRAGLELFLPPAVPAGDESVASFIQRRFGSELLERIAQPLVGGIYTGDVHALSAQAALSHFVALEGDYGSVIKGLLREEGHRSGRASGARYHIFNSLKGGVGSLVEALSQELGPHRIRLNSGVRSLNSSTGGHWSVICSDGSTLNANAVIIAVPARQAAVFIRSVDVDLADHLAEIENSSVVVINFLFHQEDLPHDLKGFGFVVPQMERRRILACSYISAKFINRAPRGMVLMRAFIGGSLNHDLTILPDEDLVLIALQELHSYLKTKAQPVQNWLMRWPQSMPQYKVGHKALIAKIKERMNFYPTLALAGNSYDGVGIPDCILSGHNAARKIINSIEAYDRSVK